MRQFFSELYTVMHSTVLLLKGGYKQRRNKRSNKFYNGLHNKVYGSFQQLAHIAINAFKPTSCSQHMKYGCFM